MIKSYRNFQVIPDSKVSTLTKKTITSRQHSGVPMHLRRLTFDQFVKIIQREIRDEFQTIRKNVHDFASHLLASEESKQTTRLSAATKLEEFLQMVALWKIQGWEKLNKKEQEKSYQEVVGKLKKNAKEEARKKFEENSKNFRNVLESHYEEWKGLTWSKVSALLSKWISNELNEDNNNNNNNNNSVTSHSWMSSLSGLEKEGIFQEFSIQKQQQQQADKENENSKRKAKEEAARSEREKEAKEKRDELEKNRRFAVKKHHSILAVEEFQTLVKEKFRDPNLTWFAARELLMSTERSRWEAVSVLAEPVKEDIYNELMMQMKEREKILREREEDEKMDQERRKEIVEEEERKRIDSG
jgi:hypothetical protein